MAATGRILVSLYLEDFSDGPELTLFAITPSWASVSTGHQIASLPGELGQIYCSSAVDTVSSARTFSSLSALEIFGGGGVQAFNSCPAS